MKIAIISPYDISRTGGVTNHVVNLSKELSNNGNDVTIIAPSSDLNFNIKSINIPFIGKPVNVNFGSTRASLCLSLNSLLRIRKIFNKNDFDLIHIHEPLVPFVSIGALFFSKFPTVLTFHASFNKGLIFKIWGFLFKDLIQKSISNIAVSEIASSSTRNYGFDINCQLIPNGVNSEIFSNNNLYSNPDIKILFVGRNEPRKGIKILLEAFILLNYRYKNLQLDLVGEGVSKLSKDYGHIANCNFHEHKEGKDLAKMYKEALIFCSPAIENESFGIVLLEAMASGLAVVVSDIEGYKGLVNNYENGILFKKNNYYSLENVMSELIENRELIDKLSLNGIEFSKNYSWNKVVEKIIINYKESLKIV